MKDHNMPIANPLVVLREEFDDWAILFNPETADAMGINPVGVAVWKQLDGSRSIEEVVAGLGKRFSEVPGTAVRDINAFVTNLVELGFVGYELKETGR
jgi:SynChlorMet cassette protein ScmD